MTGLDKLLARLNLSRREVADLCHWPAIPETFTEGEIARLARVLHKPESVVRQALLRSVP